MTLAARVFAFCFAEDAVMEPTVLEQLRICFRAKKLQPAEIIGTLSENYHGYAQVTCCHGRQVRFTMRSYPCEF